jgi:hypothetical protein
MGIGRTDAWAAVFVLASLAIGCSGDAGSPPPAGRGSVACHEWHGAYCGLLAKCQASNAACDQVKGIACRSDDEARQCAKVLNAMQCAAPPTSCDVGAVADPAPAQKACEDFETALCARTEECQPGSQDACLEQVKAALACAKAIGVGLSYEQCMVDVAKLACAASAGPDSCKGVILINQ